MVNPLYFHHPAQKHLCRFQLHPSKHSSFAPASMITNQCPSRYREFSQLRALYSRLRTPDSVLPTPYSCLRTPYSEVSPPPMLQTNMHPSSPSWRNGP